ncbi:unnamed protein product [Euphydryas editha]|uniref:Sphingomyelin phosphodiesterase C-terminal domain-containing protein n=1 Tax=Euphydryas editha TaxID=104508 RepID=A0AAU9V6L7_EUPED|nr:unnamed protein product [Euphydryas editha]
MPRVLNNFLTFDVPVVDAGPRINKIIDTITKSIKVALLEKEFFYGRKRVRAKSPHLSVSTDHIGYFWHITDFHYDPLYTAQGDTRRRGYYTIEQSHSKLRIVALNTNLFSVSEANGPQAKRQWEWLNQTLEKATTNNEMVYIVGHAAPGSDSRYNAYSVDANSKYLRLVRRHARIIAGQFFGHLHVDTFRVIYDKDQPVSWAFLAPSLSPHHDPAGSSNPGLRLYKFDSDTGKVLDYTQFYLDLAVANRAVAGAGAEWVAEYNLTQYYVLRDVSAESLHHLADKLRIGTTQEMTMFHKYLRAYNVRHDSADNCDGACAHQHFCAITCLEHIAYRQCVEAAASALAASGRSAALTAPLVNMILTLILCIVVL